MWEENWKEFLYENKDYNQVVFRIVYHLRISKKIGGNKTQVLNDIRRIPKVTTVFRIKKGYEDEKVVLAPYAIKFALKKGENPDIFVRKTLKPSIKRIEGVGIQGSEGLEKVRL